MEKKNKAKRKSIKFRLIILPLLIIAISISGVAIRSSLLIRSSLVNQMKFDGLEISYQTVEQIKTADSSMEVINKMIDNNIRSVAKTVISNRNDISNGKLIQIADDLDVEEINVYNENGEIIYSNLDENIGFLGDENHLSHVVLSGEKPELIEDLRKSTVSEDYYKYGYMLSPTGKAIQVGVIANQINALSEEFSYQNIVENLVESENIVYALFTDKNFKAIAHSNLDRIGFDLSEDKGTKIAIEEGEVYTSEDFYEGEEVDVYDIIVPVIIDGEHIGALNIGLSMEDVYSAVTENTIRVGILGVIAFVLIGSILFLMSKYVLKLINAVKEQLNNIASGDLTTEFSEEYLNLKDEFGEMISSIVDMKSFIKSMIENISVTSEHLAASSEELTATSQQSATASEEIARTIEEMAKGASEQAQSTEQGAENISELGNIIEKDQLHIKSLNKSANEVNKLKDEGLDILIDLVQKTKINNKSSKEIQEIIMNTNESAEKIENASKMIEDIATQTNLLALNAAIEAARAGEAGKGFAVVAEEIRKLAEQSNTFTEEIAEIIEELTEKTSYAVDTMESVSRNADSQSQSVELTSKKFEGINNAIENMKKVIKEINMSGNDMEDKKNQIIEVIENLSAIAEENAAGSEQTSASVQEQTASMEEIANASEALAELSEEMQESIKKFKY